MRTYQFLNVDHMFSFIWEEIHLPQLGEGDQLMI